MGCKLHMLITSSPSCLIVKARESGLQQLFSQNPSTTADSKRPGLWHSIENGRTVGKWAPCEDGDTKTRAEEVEEV
jgi:hypothetical protein